MLNSGIAFGLLPGISNIVIAIVLVVLVVNAVNMRELIVRLGLGMMIAGGVGNLYERIIYGGVRDNLDFYGLFYNNVWDYLIVGGAIVYLIHLARQKILNHEK